MALEELLAGHLKPSLATLFCSTEQWTHFPGLQVNIENVLFKMHK